MNLLMNASAKKLLLTLIVLFLLGIIISQTIVYINVIRFKNEIIMHDYKLAGYLNNNYPELSPQIQEAFTSKKTFEHFQTGKNILEKSGYTKNTEIYLLPSLDKLYKTNIIVSLVCFGAFSAITLLVVYLFLNKHYKRIDKYTQQVHEIMDGKISTKLDDSDEGNLSKLATSINVMSSSLHTHIEKEKRNKLFLKNILSNISHQLKTPLSALFMYTQIMKEEDKNNEVVSKFLDKSENELERMESLIANLLKLAKLDAGIIKLNKEKIILNNLIERIYNSFETRLEREQKKFEFKGNKKVSYICDKEWMIEALSNIVKNSIEHTEEDQYIRVSIKETPLLTKIIIEDNGKGIHPDDINHIFKRFYRSKFSQNKQGIGIGLALTKMIIEMHDGFITVESNIRKGTKITINLSTLQNCKA